VKARLLHSLIAEKVSAEPGPGEGWTVGLCRHCDASVWLSRAWVVLLAGDPAAVATCFECACDQVENPR
jgi:hypothetical protein